MSGETRANTNCAMPVFVKRGSGSRLSCEGLMHRGICGRGIFSKLQPEASATDRGGKSRDDVFGQYFSSRTMSRPFGHNEAYQPGFPGEFAKSSKLQCSCLRQDRRRASWRRGQTQASASRVLKRKDRSIGQDGDCVSRDGQNGVCRRRGLLESRALT